MANPAAQFAAQFLNYAPEMWQREWKVNGVWNRLLSHSFLGAGFTVAAEVRNRWDLLGNNHEEADLVVYNNVNANGQHTLDIHPNLVYEGKGGANLHDFWPQIRNQLRMWINGYKGDGQNFLTVIGHPCWAIGARGDQVTFWLYTANARAAENATMLPVTAVQNGAQWDVIINPATQSPGQANGVIIPPPVNNTYAFNAPETAEILRFIVADPLAHQLRADGLQAALNDTAFAHYWPPALVPGGQVGY